MKLKLAYTKVHFNCMPAIDLEEYMMDDTSFREMCETIRPSLDIFVVATYSHEKEQLPKGNELRLATRQLIVGALGVKSTVGKLRVWRNAGWFRISCQDTETFLRVLRFIKDQDKEE